MCYVYSYPVPPTEFSQDWRDPLFNLSLFHLQSMYIPYFVDVLYPRKIGFKRTLMKYQHFRAIM